MQKNNFTVLGLVLSLVLGIFYPFNNTVQANNFSVGELEEMLLDDSNPPNIRIQAGENLMTLKAVGSYDKIFNNLLQIAQNEINDNFSFGGDYYGLEAARVVKEIDPTSNRSIKAYFEVIRYGKSRDYVAEEAKKDLLSIVRNNPITFDQKVKIFIFLIDHFDESTFEADILAVASQIPQNEREDFALKLEACKKNDLAQQVRLNLFLAHQLQASPPQAPQTRKAVNKFFYGLLGLLHRG
jgi:hypothetical protein